MSDEESASVLDDATDALERVDVVIPPRLLPHQPGHSGRSAFRTAVTAVIVLVLSVLLGRRRR